ncbi:hypothetical protein AB664_19565 [Brucella anthropi]|uniref:Uncharacterized protein n=1 Tax=Brucella anthropi TaxID=529 RepID=A0A656Z2C0_BRUAN|nr:hypothetical protein AB664_19565 [Brucella anthropi]
MVKFRVFLCSFWLLSGTVFEPEAIISGFKDVAVMSEPVEQCSRHFGITKHACPFTEAEIGGNYDARALVKFAEQME